MKRYFSILLITVLIFNPILVCAAESPAEPTTSESGLESSNSVEDTSVVETHSEPTTQPDTAGFDNNAADISNDVPDTSFPNTDNSTTSFDNTESLTNTNPESTPDEDAGHVEDNEADEESSDEASEEQTEDSLEEPAEITEEHEHNFTYICNYDGTHTIKCTGHIHEINDDGKDVEKDCDYEETEPCTFDENGMCIYCGYTQELEQEFNPTISFSISNSSCEIGKSNPVICAYINDDNFDIAYAQVCFANYSNNDFINVGLAQGKYFNHLTEEFVFTSDDGWYACPNIDEEYTEGHYTIRSIYVRSTTGESIHYSLESGTLEEQYMNTSVDLYESDDSPFAKILNSLSDNTPNNTEPEEVPVEEPPVGEPISEAIEILDPEEESDEEELGKEELNEKDIDHDHKFEYFSNNDGTHTVICTGHITSISEDGETIETNCDYEEIEECSFDKDGKCIYCGYIQGEEKQFNPSISFSINNHHCVIGESNPIICLNITQEDYDIAYAQASFANYANNNFINVGLSQGQYFDHIANAFVFTSDEGWYASPIISDELSAGTYTLRSVYVRSTTGETIHYSLESDSLEDKYQNYSIYLSSEDVTTYEEIKELLPERPWEEDSDNGSSVEGEPVSESIEIENPEEEPSDEDTEELDEELDEDSENTPEEHEHELEYTSNGDGTHIIKCTGTIKTISDDGEEIEVPCDYEDVEECTYNDDGICIHCDYEQEKIFEPSVSFSITNSTCRIDDTNPVVGLFINQEFFDIAYAQVCFANYANNKFINVGLSQGKYYDHINNEFIYTSDDGWYASPNIGTEFTAGQYSVRAMYIRSTNGDTVHYSLESNNLSEEFQNISLTLLDSDTSTYDLIRETLPERPWSEEDTAENVPEGDPISESTEIENPEEEPSDEDFEEIDEELEETQEEHIHEFEYIDNNDGTHAVKCNGTITTISSDGEEVETECDYEEIEECVFDEDGKCIYCSYEKEKIFKPAISFNASTQTCKIGNSNPVISLDISQEDYDIAYAQVCFADYGKNKFINVGLSQGKYYDHINNEFVYIGDNNWYASPNITEEYPPGSYSVRSIYIRSSNGDFVHYSLESDSLINDYQVSTINLIENDTISYEELSQHLPEKPWADIEPDIPPEGEPISESIVIENSEESEPEESENELDKELEDHVHEFVYTSNGDGTHTVECTGHITTISDDGKITETDCDYEIIEECVFDEDGKCYNCGYELEKEFKPSVSFSSNSQTCTVGETDPVICLFISQDDFNIDYAQICYANYSQNKFINVGLTQGKYFDHKSGEFVYTSDDGWYASPCITNYYSEGTYSIRSLYIRSVSGETIHYSLETDTLDDSYQGNKIIIKKSQDSSSKSSQNSSEKNVVERIKELFGFS